jgi:hypothetical protein
VPRPVVLLVLVLAVVALIESPSDQRASSNEAR